MECQLSMLDDMTTGALVKYKIIDGVYESIPPTTLNSSMIEFRVHSSEHFIELDKTELEIFFELKKLIIMIWLLKKKFQLSTILEQRYSKILKWS